MSYAYDQGVIAASASADARASFIRSTYLHLAGAILAFAGIEFAILRLVPEHTLQTVMMTMFGGGIQVLIMMVLFIGVSYLAQSWALNTTSQGMQYAGLSLYVAVEAVIFLPLLYIADRQFPGAIQSAGIMTLFVFGGLTAAALITQKDFSFLGPIIAIGSLVAIGFLVAGLIFQFPLGLFFSFAMVALACACILYQTSNVMHQYRTDQAVAAALALFAAVALLFWWILRIAMASRNN
jgi:FtsH-binding integral membrane protein